MFGRSVTATSKENIGHFHHMAGWRMTKKRIDNHISVSMRALRIFCTMNLVRPRFLSVWMRPDQMRTGLNKSRENLSLIHADSAIFLERFLTQDDC